MKYLLIMVMLGFLTNVIAEDDDVIYIQALEKAEDVESEDSSTVIIENDDIAAGITPEQAVKNMSKFNQQESERKQKECIQQADVQIAHASLTGKSWTVYMLADTCVLEDVQHVLEDRGFRVQGITFGIDTYKYYTAMYVFWDDLTCGTKDENEGVAHEDITR